MLSVHLEMVQRQSFYRAAGIIDLRQHSINWIYNLKSFIASGSGRGIMSAMGSSSPWLDKLESISSAIFFSSDGCPELQVTCKSRTVEFFISWFFDRRVFEFIPVFTFFCRQTVRLLKCRFVFACHLSASILHKIFTHHYLIDIIFDNIIYRQRYLHL